MIRWDDATLAKLLGEYEAGATQTELAGKWGLSKSHIRQRLMRAERRINGGGPISDRNGIIVRGRKPGRSVAKT